MSETTALERFATYKDVAKLFFKYARKLGSGSDSFASEFQLEEDLEPSEDATEFASDLENLGPTFIKIGQLLSTRADLLPPGWIAALQRLQDDVEPVPFEQIQERIEEELGVRLSKLYHSFEEKPLASASLGQVHRAILRDGTTEVVVKVQRPGVRQRVANELEAIERVATFIQNHTEFGNTYDIERMFQQFKRAISGELNYLKEAQNLKRLGQNLSRFPNLEVPCAFEDLSSTGILTMQRVNGVKVTDLSGVVLAEIDSEGLAEELFRAYLKQILIDGFFHADPHPGNILLTTQRRLALIDLGMVGTVSDNLKDQLIRLLGSVSEGRSEDAAQAAIQMGTRREGFREKEFHAAIKLIVEGRQGESVDELQVGALVMKITEACGQNGLRIPDSVFMIGKMLLNLDTIGNTLSPDFNPDECIRKHLSEIVQERMRDHFSIGNIVNYLSEVREMFADTPGRFNELMEKVAGNEIRVKVDAIDEDKLLKGFHRVANRITVGIILAALIIGASMMMSIQSDFSILGYPGLAIIFFLIAATGGLVLVFRILFGSERG